jgi:hypothetical protein
MVKPPLRTKSIGFKVSEEEYAQTGNGGADERSDAGRVVPRGGVGECQGCRETRSGTGGDRGSAPAAGERVGAGGGGGDDGGGGGGDGGGSGPFGGGGSTGGGGSFGGFGGGSSGGGGAGGSWDTAPDTVVNNPSYGGGVTVTAANTSVETETSTVDSLIDVGAASAGTTATVGANLADSSSQLPSVSGASTSIDTLVVGGGNAPGYPTIPARRGIS